MFTFSLDPLTTVQLVLTVFMPIIVGLITTKATSGSVKAWLLAGATLTTSLLLGLYDSLSASASFDLGAALLAAIPAFAISVAMHYGLWKPTGVSEKAQETFVTEK